MAAPPLNRPRDPVTGRTPLLPEDGPSAPSAHPPLEGCEPITVTDLARGRATQQSSARSDRYSGWMFATEPEAEPWWEIDLAEAVLVERITLWLAPCPPDVEICVAAHVYHTRTGEPVADSYHHRARVGDLPLSVDGSVYLQITPDAVARHVRVALRGGAPASLLVQGAEILAAKLFGGTLLGSYARAFTLFADRPLFAARPAPGEGAFAVTHLYRDVWTAARRLAAALAVLLEPEPEDERIFLGICARNRPEWVIADLAAVMRGYVVVPLSPDDSDDRLAGILARCPLGAVLVDGDGADRFSRLAARSLIITCDPRPGSSRAPARLGFTELLARGAEITAPPPRPRDARDLYSLLFTSGSSGVPKGAMRSYASFRAMLASYGAPEPAIHLSFQPLSHLSERMYLPCVMMHGGLVGFSAGGAHVLSDLRALEPTTVGSVPRLFEVVHADHRRRLAAALAASPNEPPEAVEARVFAESRQVFGARVQAIGVGSAPSSPELRAFLQRCFSDLWITDGYGSTECGTIAVSGQVRGHVEVKLAPVPGIAEDGVERGEICVRTPHVIDGYYGDPAATAASLDDEGFFRTGDLGERDADGRIRIVGRVTNVIKLGQGEFVAVDRVEAELATCPLVDQIFVHPDASSSALLAVVVPHFDALGRLLGAADRPRDELAAHPDAPRAIARALDEHGRRAGLASFEIPRAILVESQPMTVESGLLTASGKLARPAAVSHYKSRLAALEQVTPREASMVEGDSPIARLAAAVSSVVGRSVDPGEPLHQGLGLDSLATAELLRAASIALGREIPLAIWFEARTLDDLARRLDRGLLGARAPGDDPPRRDLDLPLPTLEATHSNSRAPFQTILLTGATGLLGAHLLEALIARTSAHVLCLVRAPSDEAAARRVRATLDHYEIPPPDPTRWSAIAADLASPELALTPARRHEIAERADAILHAAAEVNWLEPYASLRAPNVLGTLELLNLAAAGRPKPLHFISTISTVPSTADESAMLAFEQARAGGGYGFSKWMAESLVRRAAERGQPAAIYRPAMITGHSRRGLGNPDDYVHRYLRASATSGRYLDFTDERLDMTPVDFVADAVVALLSAQPEGGATHHLTNIDQSMSYAELGRAFTAAGHPCEPASYAEFRAAAVDPPTSPLYPLGAFFPESGFRLHMGPWPSDRTRSTLANLGVICPRVDDRLIATYLAALARQGLIANR